jgi:hypothetical protein
MKILVCVLGQIRCPELTWGPFKKWVLDELGADLITCGPDAAIDSPFTKMAIMNIYSESKVKTDHINAQIVLDHRNVLMANINPTQWDQIILTRSDHMWYGPHPRLDLEHFWFMNSEFHFGISDRHTVVSSEDFEFIIKIGKVPFGSATNIEQFIYYRLNQLGLWGPKIALSPFHMYLTGPDHEWRRPDEKDASKDTITWPFMLVHNEVTCNGMFTGRAVSL